MVAEPDDDPPAPGPAVDRFDMEIVEFMLSWAPYGGPPEEECVPLFGCPLIVSRRGFVRSSTSAGADI